MKKIITFLVLIIVLISTVGYIFLLKINLYIIHKEVKYELMSQNNYEKSIILTIPISQQNPINSFIEIHSREFRYKGEMYDVISRYDSADVTVFRCIHDIEESNLFNVFTEILKINKSEGHQSRLKYFPNVFNFYFFEISNINFKILSNEIIDLIIYKFSIIKEYYPPKTPPPIFS